MLGRRVVLDQIGQRGFGALLVNGTIEDLLFDPPDASVPRLGAIYRGTAARRIKGMGGTFFNLSDTQRGFLRGGTTIPTGEPRLLQISGYAEQGKAPTVVERVALKGRYAILTVGARGINSSRRIQNKAIPEALETSVRQILDDRSMNAGLIFRTAIERAAINDASDEITELLDKLELLLATTHTRCPELLLDGPSVAEIARREWLAQENCDILDDAGSFEAYGLWDQVEQLRVPEVPLAGGGTMHIEATRAMVTVDVNTGSDTTAAAGLKANLTAINALPREIRIRGLGGQIVVDFAPMSRKFRTVVENAIKTACKSEKSLYNFPGWTPLGHYEILRKRDRQPLDEVLSQ